MSNPSDGLDGKLANCLEPNDVKKVKKNTFSDCDLYV